MLLLSALALADVLPIPPPQQQFISHTVKVEFQKNYEKRAVVILYPESEKISAYQAFTFENQEAILSEPLYHGKFGLMTASDFATWETQTREEIARQEAACSERGEGCDHISRFTAHFAPPTNILDCRIGLEAASSGPLGGHTAERHHFRLDIVESNHCGIMPLSTVTSGGPPPPPAPVEPPPAPVESADPPTSGGCAVVGSAGAGAILLSMVLGMRRRCRF